MMFFDEYMLDMYNPWLGSAEKSQSAKRREKQAKEKFDALRAKMERAIVGNKTSLIELGCKPESPSVFGMLPSVTIEQILDFFREKPQVEEEAGADETVAAKSSAGKTNNAKAAAKSSKKKAPPSNENGQEVVTTLTDMMGEVYVPGKTFLSPLLKPNCHLTGPCWRDFSRAVREHDGWNVKRVEATPAEKKEYGESRKGKVYFVNAIFTVPGGKAKKKRARKHVSANQEEGAPSKKKAKSSTSSDMPTEASG